MLNCRRIPHVQPQRFCQKKRVSNFVDTVGNQKDSPLAAGARPAIQRKSQHTLAINAGAAGSKLFFSFPPPRNSCVPTSASDQTRSLLNDGGGFLRPDQYHFGKLCQPGFTSIDAVVDNDPTPVLR